MPEKIGDVPVKLTCRNCGKEVPVSNSAAPDDMVSCPACETQIASVADIRKAGKKRVAIDAKALLRKGLKRR